jgi:hypothetical protein
MWNDNEIINPLADGQWGVFKIYILTNDLGYADVSFLGQSKFSITHIDELANNWMVCERINCL